MNLMRISERKDLEDQKAYEDLWSRTLSSVPGDLNRLIYLASTRDYNSGRYYHAGLEARYGVDAVQHALESAHREVFWKLTRVCLKDLVSEIAQYISCSREPQEEILNAWRTLQPYRVAVPLSVDPLAATVLLSNIKLGLEVLHNRPAQLSTRP